MLLLGRKSNNKTHLCISVCTDDVKVLLILTYCTILYSNSPHFRLKTIKAVRTYKIFSAASLQSLRLSHSFVLSLLFPFWSSPNSTDGQQTTQQSPPTVEVTPPDSQPEDNGVMEQTEGQWIYRLCKRGNNTVYYSLGFNKDPVNNNHTSVPEELSWAKRETLHSVIKIKLTRL